MKAVLHLSTWIFLLRKSQTEAAALEKETIASHMEVHAFLNQDHVARDLNVLISLYPGGWPFVCKK